MSIGEYEILILIGLIVSVYTAFSVRIPIHKIPWITLILNPRYLGGYKQIFQHLLWLLGWVITSVSIYILIALFIRSFEPLVKELYDLMKYKISDGKAGIATLTVLSITFYVLCVNKAKELISIDRISDKERLTSQSDPNDANSNPFPRKINFLKPFQILFYIFPRIFQIFLSYFFYTCSTLENASALLMIEKYGTENCLGFFDQHLRKNPNKEMKYLNELRSDCLYREEEALLVIKGKISLVGFSATENLILNYILFNRRNTNSNQRGKRIVTQTPIKIEFKGEKGRVKGEILDYSANGTGCFLTTKNISALNGKIFLENEGSNIEGEIMHNNAKLVHDTQKIESGLGIKINDDCASIFLKKMKPSEGSALP